ncbi:MAG: FlgD immunoglobulin-like domain containing protein, partial [Candidatus Neomarinimicrobiota bacterium]
NIGVGNLTADITYPESMSGPASISGLAPGAQDSMVITYTPTVPGIEFGTIVVDGSGSGAAVSNIPFDANAGELAFDLENRPAGWRNYSLAGEPWTAPSGSVISDRWTWWGGPDAHSGTGFYGVYGYEPYWGGVDDYLVSPRYNNTDVLEVLSFYTAGYYNSGGSDPDSINVWVSTEMPVMGFEEIPGPGPGGMLSRVDTGFVNTDAFTMVYASVPDYYYEPVNIDLSSYGTDVWVLIHSMQAGWRLRVDDLATPDIYISQEPILNAVARYNFGTTSPAGDTVSLGIINSGVEDLVIDSLELANGSAYNLDLVDAEFPVTVMQDSIIYFPVVFAPYEDGPAMDTLMYYSNYTEGNMDANGYGTATTVLSGLSLNAPPQPVMLLTPDNNAVLTIDSENADGETGIFWTNSSDPDGNEIEYILELVFENTGDTLDTALSVTNFFLSHAEALEYMVDVGVTQLEVTWNVFAEDGFSYSPSSNGPFNLVIDGGWALSVDNNTIPEVFALHNNYPNPFNPVTNIGYDIPELSKVNIDIYNIAGNKVKTLVSKEHQPGRYKIQWNATNEFGAPVATGMYIYKIRAKDFVSVKKLLLMK